MNLLRITGRKLKRINVNFFVVSDGRVAQAGLRSWYAGFIGTGLEWNWFT